MVSRSPARPTPLPAPDGGVSAKDGAPTAIDAGPPAADAGASAARSASSVERRLAVQYAIARAFAEADELDDVSAGLLQNLADALGWQSASLWVLAEDGLTLRCAAIHPTDGPLQPWAEYTLGFRPEIGVGLPGRVWASGESFWISDTRKDQNFLRQALARAVGLRHGFAFPIRSRGSVVAVVELFAAEVREVDPEQAELLEAVGHQLGSFIERTESRRAVAHSEARKTAILNAAVDGIVVADSEGRVVDFNPAAEALFGRSRDEVLGRRIADVLVPDDLRPQHEAGLARYLATGESRILGRRVRTWAAHADGSRIPVELTITALQIDDRPMFTAFIRDVTRERQAETARDRFLEILSHELRTPVTSIYGGAKVAVRPTISREQQVELLTDIASEADHLYRLVEDLMVLARAERGAGPISLEPVSLDRVVEGVVTDLAARWPGLEFRVRPTGLGLPVQADSTYLEQLLRNIVTNAAKYGGAGGVVEVEIDHGETESIVRVLDRGPGVNESEVRRLFEIDYRSPLTEGLAQGSGIGLFVARWLVEGMGGRIWAVAREGGGSEFGFALPTVTERDPMGVEADAIVRLDSMEIFEISGVRAPLGLEPETS